MNDSNDMPAAMREPLKFPAGVAKQDQQDASIWRHLRWQEPTDELKGWL